MDGMPHFHAKALVESYNPSFSKTFRFDRKGLYKSRGSSLSIFNSLMSGVYETFNNKDYPYQSTMDNVLSQLCKISNESVQTLDNTFLRLENNQISNFIKEKTESLKNSKEINRKLYNVEKSINDY